MILDGRKINDRITLDYDICIVGSGPAGITVALELESSKKRICILEAGGREESREETKEFYMGENVGLPYNLETTRSRCFGGTSNSWDGFWSILDPQDFKKRIWIPNSGWPISFEELQPYNKRAHHLLGINPFEYNPQKWAAKDYELIEFASREVTNKIWHFKTPRFTKMFGKRLEKSSNIDVYLNSTLTEIHLNNISNRIRFLKVNTSKKKTFNVKAKQVVLACGGLENARILLAQNERMKNNFTNDNIGRYFQEHPHYSNNCSNMILFCKNANSKLYRQGKVLEGKTHVRTFFQITEEIQKKERFPNAAFTFIRNLESAELHLRVLKILKRLYHPNSRSYRMSRIIIMSEQFPNDLSRVTLSKQRDKYGIPRIKLDWRLKNEEIEMILKSTHFLGLKLGQNGVGRLQLNEWFAQKKIRRFIRYGSHHMGTTRMATSSKTGVVNTNCRVFGLENLSIAGSSIFPTGGCANPSLTILALAIRLADHLKYKI